MAQFRAKKLDLSCFVNVRVIRDHTKRKVFEQYETQRQALRYIIRNTTLPQRARAQAQLQLSQMHAYTRFTQINNRCIEGGKSRGVLRHFRMARYPFRMNALEGNIPGVKKANLKELGYFINDKDQVRSIKDPEQEFNYFISKNDRINVMQREAFNTCIRRIIHGRLLGLSLDLTTVPLGTPLTEPHVPIYTSANISTCPRLIIYIGEAWQDLGVFAWRTVGQESIASGSVINFVHTAQQNPDNPGVLVANTGQLLWYRGGQRAVTQTTWAALPRRTAVSPPMEIDEVKNRVPGNNDAIEHIAHIFDEVIPKMARADVKIDVIGMGDGGPDVVRYLQASWEKCHKNIQAIAIGAGFVWQMDDIGKAGPFKEFWGDRARAYIQSTEPVDTPLIGRKESGCNCYSAGEGEVLERIMPNAYESMLRFFQLVNDVPGYRELAMIEEEEFVLENVE
ncbi:MAG: hypothetical protein Q9219_001102 [cf. Caloplaca sp. 3 TL-2023]